MLYEVITGAGVQQLMAGARKFRLCEITRDELFSANRETEKETGIPIGILVLIISVHFCII